MQSSTLRYLDNGNIDLIEVEVEEPGPGEIQLEGGACGICSWDIVTCKLGSDMRPMAPPGHEGLGYVAKVGSGVKGFKEGDRVAGGGFASRRNLPAERVYKIPESELADQYWIVEPVSCIVTGLDHCRLRPGDRVAVIGTGFMGLMMLQGLLHSYAEEIIAIDVVQSRLDLAQQLGVKELYNVAKIDPAELAPALQAREIDVVVDTSGNQAGLDLATDIAKRGGLINLFGWIKGQNGRFDPTKWHGGGFTIVNSSPSAKIRDPFPPAIRLIQQGIIDLRPLVTHTVPLAEYPGLMKQILKGDPTYVKGVITL
jgi:threonine dehydrogenase-like Zn-dependent dehydrogenase